MLKAYQPGQFGYAKKADVTFFHGKKCFLMQLLMRKSVQSFYWFPLFWILN